MLVPEGRQLFDTMSVQENLEMGAFSKRARRRFAERLDQIYTLFPRLKERARQKAGTLSGGEQQMLAIARGIMSEPEVLIIDELSLGLAPVIVQQLTSTLKALKASGMIILLVEQNVQLALSDYAYVIAEGRTFTEGSSRSLTIVGCPAQHLRECTWNRRSPGLSSADDMRSIAWRRPSPAAFSDLRRPRAEIPSRRSMRTSSHP